MTENEPFLWFSLRLLITAMVAAVVGYGFARGLIALLRIAGAPI